MAALSQESPSTLKGPAAAARARKRRMALRKQNAFVEEVIDGGSNRRTRSNKTSTEVLVDPVTNELKPSITGIKKQSRYIPGVPMTKEELKAWRKEARRVRNRESAAASRRKNRDRTGVLEGEVETMTSKYAAALRYIMDLEGSSNDSFTPQVLRQDLMETRENSLPSQVRPTKSFSFGVAPLSLNAMEEHDRESIGNGGISSYDITRQQQQQPHIMAMISRPTAACVLIS